MEGILKIFISVNNFSPKIYTMDKKLYLCEIPNCGRKVPIRSTIKKNEEFLGKKCCSACKAKLEGVSKPRVPLKSFNPKTREARKILRQGLPEFFEKSIAEMKLKPWCEDCGCRINTEMFPANNIAHILPKRIYKSVMTEANNRLFLCTEKDESGLNCHWHFDNRIEARVNKPIFSIAVERFNTFESKITERGKEYFQLKNF